MLRVMRRGGGPVEALLTAEHDAALRAAFGRTGRAAARPVAATVVNAHYAVGRWFTCDCRGDVRSPPVLIPVIGSFVRRHVEGAWPEHAEWCDFYREPSTQAMVSASYGRDAATGLVRAFAGEAERLRQDLVHRGGEQRRSRLARLLFRLLDAAGLATFRYGQARTVPEQLAALRQAATSVQLEDTMPVSSALCTYRPALQEFLDRIAAIPSVAFRKTGNPHGVFVGLARAASRGVIEPVRGDPVRVAGEIAIFGERDGIEERDDAAAARAPYLMACLVGRRAPRARVEVLRAYLHPCMSATWLFPVDSDFERHTMMQLVALGRWFDFRRGCPVTIRKPLWHMARSPEGPSGAEVEAHEPIIPDFIVEAGEGDAARRAVVETMGYAQAAYRARKQHLRPEMMKLAAAPVVEHDFHLPADWLQRERDSAFWFACREVLTGSKPGASSSTTDA